MENSSLMSVVLGVVRGVLTVATVLPRAGTGEKVELAVGAVPSAL